jgi:hypothetical protein
MSNLSISNVKEEVRIWRRSKQAGEKMPAVLWDKIINLAKEIGPGKAAKEFALDFYQVRERCQQAGPLNQTSQKLASIHITKIPPFESHSRAPTTIEFENQQGTKLRLCDSSPLALCLLKEFFNKS